MHDEHVAAGRAHGLDEALEIGVFILLVDAEAALHRDRNRDRRAHRGDAVGDERGLAHQACAEASRLHAIGRATDVEIDLVVAERFADARGGGELARLRTAELQRDRMLDRIEPEQPRAIAVQHGRRRDHLGVEPRVRRQQTVEEPAVAVRPVHHRGDAQPVGDAVH